MTDDALIPLSVARELLRAQAEAHEREIWRAIEAVVFATGAACKIQVDRELARLVEQVNAEHGSELLVRDAPRSVN